MKKTGTIMSAIGFILWTGIIVLSLGIVPEPDDAAISNLTFCVGGFLAGGLYVGGRFIKDMGS